MTKIIPISEQQAMGPRPNVKKASDVDFKDSLSKAMESRAASGSGAGLPPLGEIQPSAYLSLETELEKIVHRTNDLLDLLGRYADDLNNPSKSLKEIAPLVDSINEKADDLIKETENLSASDEKLRKIASDVALTAQMELIKFQRGDYI